MLERFGALLERLSDEQADWFFKSFEQYARSAAVEERPREQLQRSLLAP
jgi:hypothetical protein